MTTLQGADLVAAIARCRPPATKLARIATSPLRAVLVAALRKLHSTRPVQVTLPWGHRFHGVLPEGVTALIHRFGAYETDTSVFVARHLQPGGCFVDIGSHFGYFTLLASHVAGPQGRVVAIEAMPDTYAMLRQNVQANGLGNVTTLNNAAAAETCALTFKDYGIVNSSLNTSALPRGVVENAGRDVPVQAHSADKMLADAGVTRVDMIKIDAESSEEFVVRGLHDTLLRDHPVTLIELGGMQADAGEDARVADIFQFMAQLGYRAYRAEGDKLVEITETRDLPYLNVIFKADHR
jgi:FkbM family methyltransferase